MTGAKISVVPPSPAPLDRSRDRHTPTTSVVRSMAATQRSEPRPVGYATDLGELLLTSIEDALDGHLDDVVGKVDLIFTSPPFPLNRKKRYGNRQGDEYLEWLVSLAKPLGELLSPTGSIVLEVGNAWEPGRPTMSTLPLRSLLGFLEAGDLELCQQFICHNPARLPTPAQWVTIERIRVKDSYTHVWWMSKTERPKASNWPVLVDYSKSMKKLMERGSYNSGVRPAGHSISDESFLHNNGGAIPPNVLTFANTRSNDLYRQFCREEGLPIHPARMQPELAEFFIKMLTDEEDLVLDPFAGSNTTGAVAERLGRRWIAVEPNREYAEGSLGRFPHLLD